MEVTLKIFRYDPDKETKGSHTEYPIDVDENATVLDGLMEVKSSHDSSLSFKGSCRTGLCGDCSVQVNGKGTVACRTTLAKALKKGKDGIVSVDPLYPAKKIKDLIYDQNDFLLEKYKSMKPWVVANLSLGAREDEVSDSTITELQRVMSCTMCGLCDQGCLVIAVDEQYVGPAALNKLYRVVMDPRDNSKREKLEFASGARKIWDCTHCFEATAHCPKDVRPTESIFELRDMAIKNGIGHGRPVNHYKSFAASVKNDGWLDETRLAIETEGWFNLPGLLKLGPVGLRAFMKRKAPLPYFLHKKRKGADAIKRIFNKWERES